MAISESILPSSVIANKALLPVLLATGLATATYAGICFALYSYQSKLIFRPLPNLLRTPDEVGLAYEDVWIPLASDISTPKSKPDKIHGWWLPNPGSKRVLLFCHGNYGNVSYNLERMRFHHALGFSVLVFDYRGFGLSTKSPAFPSEKSTYTDAEVAWNYLVSERKIAPEQITVCGHSMGGAVAIDLATRHPDMANLIVKSSFTTMEDAIEAKKIYRAFPIKQLLAHPFDSLSKVNALKMPVLYVHGEQDFDVPAKFSHRLFAATPEPKQLWIAPGAEHNDISSVQGDAYAKVLESFCSTKQLQSA